MSPSRINNAPPSSPDSSRPFTTSVSEATFTEPFSAASPSTGVSLTVSLIGGLPDPFLSIARPATELGHTLTAAVSGASWPGWDACWADGYRPGAASVAGAARVAARWNVVARYRRRRRYYYCSYWSYRI